MTKNILNAIVIGALAARSHMNAVTTTLGEYQKWELKIPSHQRQAFAWKNSDVELLMDTIARSWALPAFFVRVKDHNGAERRTLEDGLQRTTALTAFLKGQLGLPLGLRFQMPEDWKNPLAITVDVDEDEIDDDEMEEIVAADVNEVGNFYDASGKRIHELPKEIVDQILDTPVVVFEMHNFTDEEARVYFTRLQGGKPLNTTEKRRASYPALSRLAARIVSNKGSRIFLENIQMKPQNTEDKRTKNNRLQAEELVTGFLATAIHDDMVALSDKTKTSLSELGLTVNSNEVQGTINTLEVLGSVSDLYDDKEIKRVLKKTVLAPLFKVTQEAIAANEMKTADDIEQYATKLKTFMADVANPDIDSEIVEDYRLYANAGSNSQTQLQGRYNILSKVLR